MDEHKRPPSPRRSWQSSPDSPRRPRIHPYSIRRSVLLFAAFSLVVLPVLGVRPSRGLAQATPPAPTSPAPPGSPAPTTGFVVPVETAAPQPDGSIVHVVEQGQALWSIAAAYQVNLDDLLALNGLTSSPIIYPGDRLLIKPADTTPSAPQTETAPATAASPASPTAAPRPTRSPTPTATQALTATSQAAVDTPTPSVQPLSAAQPRAARSDPLLVVIAVLVFTGTTLVIAGSALKRSA